MTLSSIIFVFGFFPIFVLIYYISKDKYRDCILLLGSIFFYYVTDLYRTKYVIALCVIVYLLTWLMSKLEVNYPNLRKVIAALGIIGIILLLFYYRYLNSIVRKIGIFIGLNNIWQRTESGVPLGLSFLTFSIISYIADCYTGKVKYQKNPIKLAVYIFMFPKIIMGPIVRYSEIEQNIIVPDVTIDNIGIGIRRFIIGFCKKVIIADNLAILVSSIQSGVDYSTTSVIVLWLGAVSYSLELLFDFSGYSDMAIGIANILGYKFNENFNYPYTANSITDFWRRWHMSLSFWFRDYIYIPLGGSRKSLCRNIVNLFVVWFITGVWHGATLNFIIWGMIYFIVIMFERFILKPNKRKSKLIRIIWRCTSLLIINFNWVIFSHSSWIKGIEYIKGMLGIYNNSFFDVSFIKYFRDYWIYLLLAICFSIPIVPVISKKINRIDKYGVMTLLSPILIIFIFIWALSFVMLGAHNPFLYQQF